MESNNFLGNNMQMFKKIFNFFLFIILIYFLLLSMQPVRYYIWYPTIEKYPNNLKEIEIMVRDYIPQRTSENIQFFKLTDDNPMEAFRGKISDEKYNKINKIITSRKMINQIIFYKKLYNRARPYQLAPELVKALKSTTADNPSYPSGHPIQAYYAARILSKLEPKRKKEWEEIAERCANIRIIAGLHYPSDIEFGKRIANKININF
jgi:membrane-associated phospholipid phosphatase